MIPWTPKFLYYFTPLIRASKYMTWRFGRRFRCSELNLETIREVLMPGMIVLSRREFQMANLFIDGYWTHSALIVSGEKVIEATSDGVIINDLPEFLLKTDDFVILKPKFCGLQEMVNACGHAMEIVGTPYSYNFDNADNAYYCSELILKAYARSCCWDKERHQQPGEFKNLCAGKIIRPADLYHNHHAWEIVFQLN
ncbi:MAG: YiiX/YebB-like N1pC/P60 family cysteine hydrolase [Bacteroidales bacterium]|nr:YiiX/YebB-like N1pC/P60 family cysteine hydrolase [Bacteroidales bacterium]